MELCTIKGELFHISPEDYERVASKTWRVHNKYIATGTGTARVLLHNFIMERDADRNAVVDHFDDDGRNNRRENLRVISQSHNTRRARRSNNTSGHPGIYALKNGTWLAQFKIFRRQVLSKTFHSIYDAISQRKAWELQYCSEELFDGR